MNTPVIASSSVKGPEPNDKTLIRFIFGNDSHRAKFYAAWSEYQFLNGRSETPAAIAFARETALKIWRANVCPG